MDNYKIKVKDEAESKEAQELFFELGFRWKWSNKREILRESIPYLFTEGKEIFYGVSLTDFNECVGKELTIPQLRDLNAQSKSKVCEYLDPNDNYKLCLINPSDAAHWMIEVPESADCLMQWPTGHKVSYRDNFTESWNNAYKEWHFVRGDDGVDQSKTLWKRSTQDPSLISGAEALRALADGKEVIGKAKDYESEWLDATHWTLTAFLEDTVYFKIKPQTIKLDIEIPAPYKAKIGGRDDTSFVLNVGRHQYCYKNEEDYTKARDALEVVFDAAVRGTNS